MAFVAAPNIVMVEWRCVRHSQNIENRLMVDMLAVPTAVAIQDLVEVCWNWWENNHAAKLHQSVNLREVVGTSLHVQNGPQVTYAPDTTTTGTGDSAEQPNEVSLCVSLRTGSRGRSARGRWYMLSLEADAMADANNVSALHASLCATSLSQLMTAINATGVVPVIVSYVSNKVPRPGGPVYFPITGATVVDTIVDSMKSRKPGVGA